MAIASGDSVSGSPQYDTLGTVRARRRENPQASYKAATDIIADGDDLQLAAYRKYESQIDAIVNANLFHVSNYEERYFLSHDEGTSSVRTLQAISRESTHNQSQLADTVMINGITAMVRMVTRLDTPRASSLYRKVASQPRRGGTPGGRLNRRSSRDAMTHAYLLSASKAVGGYLLGTSPPEFVL